MGSQRKLSEHITNMLVDGRRNSATNIVSRLRSGSLPGWIGGSPLFPPTVLSTIDTDHGSPHTHEQFNEEDDDDEDGCDKEHDSFTKANRITIIALKQEQIRVYDPVLWRQQGNANLGNLLSALYAKLLVVMGIAFPMSEVISTYIPTSFYDAFYLYLYFVSILFMGSMFGHMLHFKPRRSKKSQQSGISHGHEESSPELPRNRHISTTSTDFEDSSDDGIHSAITTIAISSHERPGLCVHRMNGLASKTARFCTLCDDTEKMNYKRRAADKRSTFPPPRTNFGNFYLRIGAVSFGIGSVIYSALEFGQYFELKDDTRCYNFLVALTPASRMVFTFIQMYFIFLNSRMAISKVSLLKQFGLMHLIGTNLAVWLNVLVQETKHEIVHFYHPKNETIITNGHGHGNDISYHEKITTADDLNSNNTVPNLTDDDLLQIHHRSKRGLSGPHNMYDCRRANIMGSLVDNASPFLFPCTIEYSLICAAICYVMWKDMSTRRIDKIALKRSPTAESIVGNHGRRGAIHHGHEKSPNYYTVDCAGSNKGLFTGILLLVFTIMSLILNFVLIKHPEYLELATLEVNITEVVLYSTSTIAVLIGMCQMRQLRYEPSKNLELDNILLIVAQSGSFLFNIFCIIGEHLAIQHFDALSLTIPLLCLVQIILQTLFILDASKRVVITPEQARRKPGREVITFLLVCNLAMWLINALEKSRGDSHPHQLHFYGVWAWTIITDFSMPLAIFYRFHSTVCLCEIWKKAHKIKTKF